MTGELKNKTLEKIESTLKKKSLIVSISTHTYLNQFLETGNFSEKAMEKFLRIAFNVVDKKLASELSDIIIEIIKNESGN